jgi:TRAP-type mannitol/chloroaromatic compound transport system permease small subunit
VSILRAYITVVDAVNKAIGRVVMFGIFILMGILLWSIVSKSMDTPSLWTLEGAQFAMIAYVFLGGPYAIQLGSHVRMDLFYDNWSTKRKAWTDAITVFCLLVYLCVLLWGAVGSTAYSLGYFGSAPFEFFNNLFGALLSGTQDEVIGTMERSRTIWRPYLWPIKAVLCVAIILMILQTVSELFKDVLRIRGEVI